MLFLANSKKQTKKDCSPFERKPKTVKETLVMNTSIDYIQVLILTEFCVNSERVITRHKTAFLNPGVSKELRNVPGLQRKTALGGDRIYML